jgi:hypothetical protein
MDTDGDVCISVALPSGRFLLQGKSVRYDDHVLIIQRLVEQTLGSHNVVLMFHEKQLDASMSIRTIGLKHGDVITALMLPMACIYSNEGAFAAVKNDGSVVTWGSKNTGGDSNSVADQLAGDVLHVYSSSTAFAAVKANGSVVTWGSQDNGGDSYVVCDQLAGDV